MHDVSVIIVSWNTRDILRRCLSSLYEQTHSILYEVIVVDNASTDGSPAMVKREFPQVLLIQNDSNRGFAAANNQGIKIAAGRHILLLNSDTIVMSGAVSRTVEFIDAHPEAGVVGCRVLNSDGSVQTTCFMYPSVLNLLLSSSYLYKIFPRSRFLGRERMTWWNRDDVREVEVVTGCFMMVRREVIERIGLLDEDYFVYGEETDWCYRISRAGWKILFTPSAEIIHLHGASSKQIKPRMRLQLSESILLFMKKHRSWPSYYLGRFLMFCFFFLRTPYWLLLAVVKGSERAERLQIVRTYLQGCRNAVCGKYNRVGL